MNFGSGTSSRPRYSISRRDPELMPALTNTSTARATRLSANITVRPVLVQRKMIRVVRNSVQPISSTRQQSQSNLECPICFGGILPVATKKPTAVLCCGYVLCGSCATRCQKNFVNCPMCNQKWRPNGVIALRFH